METINQNPPVRDLSLALEVRKEAIRIIAQLKNEGKSMDFIQMFIEELYFLHRSLFVLT